MTRFAIAGVSIAFRRSPHCGRNGLLFAERARLLLENNLRHLVNWAIEQDLTVGQLLQMPFYHPVIEEAFQAALYDLYGKVDAKNETPITELVPLT